MERLIKESDVIKAFAEYASCDYSREADAREDIQMVVGQIPTADTEIQILEAEAFAKGIDSERKRISDWCRPQGEWIESFRDEYCGTDEEHEAIYRKVREYVCDQCGNAERTIKNFCPECGARMKGEDDEY